MTLPVPKIPLILAGEVVASSKTMQINEEK